MLLDRHALEEEVEVGLDHLVEQDEPVVADRLAGDPLELQEARQHRRDLDPRESPDAGLGIAQADGDRQGQGRDVREAMARVDREWRQDGVDLLDEAPPERRVVLRDLAVVEQLDPGAREGRGARPGRSTSAPPRARARGPGSRAAGPPGPNPPTGTLARPARTCWRSPATRIWKNSSRLFATIARNFTRSSRGFRGSRASYRTRALNSIHESSRSRYRLRRARRDLPVAGLGRRHLGAECLQRCHEAFTWF